ncbi:MAG: CoA ester lyase [Ilumatobacteraceae bacterium]|nr:CoA ester lyase [Ilumatobacteraceae bacterium]
MRQPPRLRRSELSTPGSNPKMLAKAAASEADVVVIDLEDGVAPDAKHDARTHTIAALRELSWRRIGRAVRINAVETAWCHDDLIAVVGDCDAAPDVIVIPKVYGPREVWFVDDLLGQLEAKHGLEPGGIGIEVLIEDVRALSRVEEIAACSPRIEALVLGVGDLAASQGMRLGHIGAASPYPGDIWHHARTRMIVAARAAGIEAIDGPYADYTDPDGFAATSHTFALLGGSGRWCIHPSQIEAVNRIFAPTAEEIAEAERVVTAVRDAAARGEGTASLDGRMIDPATARNFELVLARAARVDDRPTSP